MISFSAVCQDNGFVNEYLQTALKDQRLNRYQSELSFLQDNKMLPSWIRETEVRIGTEGLDNSIEDYRLRISPSNPWEINANKHYRNQLMSNTETRYQISLTDALLTRYNMLITSYFLTTQISLLQEEIDTRKNLSDQLVNISSGDVEMEDLINMEADLGKAEIKLKEYQNELDKINSMINNLINKEVNWASFEFIAPATIESILVNQDSLHDNNLYKLMVDQELLLQQSLYKVNKTEAFSNIGFFQANYETDRGETLQEHMGIQVGITIPLANRDKADLARDRFELIQYQSEKERVAQEMDEELASNQMQLNASLQLYDLVHQKLERAALLQQDLNSTVKASAILELESYRIELLMKQSRTHQEITERFIEYLNLKGYLGNTPLVNYLSDQLTYNAE
ncbi:MAG: hypothetical protein R3345_10640 [Fulvivirga sp.]|nr:hypothetical protein [Fulvivirga sp.]